MKQLVILSGKGGTGKTSLAAAFAHLAFEGCVQTVLADGDVDAANLELVLQPRRLEEHEFIGGSTAVIEAELCQGCDICEQVCRFEAISSPDSGHKNVYQVDPIACDGCAACVYQCPEEAIYMQPQLAGHWFRSETHYGPLFHAELRPAQENSGKLVTMVKQQARLLGLDTGAQVVIVDGPPGIGCPVISAVSGADLALIVAEPTAAGIHDMDRVLNLTKHFRVPTLVCINKANLYPHGANQIKDYCEQNYVEVVGSVPFDEIVTEAMLQGFPVTIYRPSAASSRALVRIWDRIKKHLNGMKS
jgi:MinD superfamily P-loop ATPase